jgi:DNA-nicking Smr family endonuclease
VRSLSPDEAALWERVAATITPLSRDKNEPHVTVKTTKKHPAGFKPQSSPLPARLPDRRIGFTLDASWDRRLSRGSVEPDRIIDLHGHSLDSAWATIDRGLERAIAADDRLVLLITGHRREGDPPLARGRIRAAVDGWLAASRHAGSIAAIRGAHRRHGGGGSLYLVLRRR